MGARLRIDGHAAEAIVVEVRPNAKIRLLTRVAFGFHGPQPLIALALLALGGHPPRLPGRA